MYFSLIEARVCIVLFMGLPSKNSVNVYAKNLASGFGEVRYATSFSENAIEKANKKLRHEMTSVFRNFVVPHESFSDVFLCIQAMRRIIKRTKAIQYSSFIRLTSRIKARRQFSFHVIYFKLRTFREP